MPPCARPVLPVRATELARCPARRPQESEEKRKKQRQEADGRRKEEEVKNAAARARVERANRLAYERLMPRVRGWASGEGPPAEVKRFGRRQELQLLTMEVRRR